MPPFSKHFYLILAVILIVAAIVYAYSVLRPASRRERWVNEFVANYKSGSMPAALDPNACSVVLAKAKSMVEADIKYDPTYYKLEYPGGDVPSDVGVCADVVIRSFRAIGIDLQTLIHEDMSRSFVDYPKLWSLADPDKNIDHRRVPNLMAYFNRNHSTIPLSTVASDYAPCDVVAWDLGGGVTHIGVVSDTYLSGAAPSSRPAVIHHISGRPSMEDVLFSWRMIGHFRLQSRALSQ